jgi:hypothetical protein
MIIMCYSIQFEEWSLTDEVVHEISLISKTSSKTNFFFLKNSEMMPQYANTMNVRNVDMHKD